MNTELLQSITIYIGHYHPLVVHLPIGIIFFLFFLECIIWFTKNESLKPIRIYLSFASMVTTLLGLMLGYFLANEGGYDPELLEKHEHSGQILAAISIAIFLINFFLNQKSYFENLFKSMALVAVVALSVVGHYGGSLTHGSDYLAFSSISKKSESSQRPEIKDINEAVVFKDLVQPIINQKCISCHNKEKMKGEFLMDTYEHIMKGGESGVVVIASNSSQSELIKLINLEPIEERAMPPKGKVPLTNDEKALLTWWIDSGASPDKKVAELNPDATAMAFLSKFAFGAKNDHNHSGENSTLLEVVAADSKVILQIAQTGINIQKIAQNTNFLDARVIINKSEWDDNKTESLLKIKEQIYVLDLSGTTITDKSLLALSKMTNLSNLMLQNTKLTDQNLGTLSSLQKLESLNLYNVPITDAGLAKLGSIKSLKKLYIWQTKVSLDAVEKLQKLNPELFISVGKNL